MVITLLATTMTSTRSCSFPFPCGHCIQNCSGHLAPATKITYAAGILRFNKFCNLWNVDEKARMPASPVLLMAFVGQVRGHYAGSTVCSWLAGIRAWHVMHQAQWHG